jgi:hypothetical protein
MKAERRHELQENVLAAWLTKQIEAVKPYWQVITGIAIIALLGVIAFYLIRCRSAAEKAVGWVDYFDAVANRDIDKLEEVADENPKAVAGLWALQAAGDERLLDGMNRLYSNPAGAKLELHKAVENYHLVLERTEEPMLVRRALFGLARAHESLQELDDAKKRYGELAEKFPDSPLGALAKQRIEVLSRPSTREFLAWLSKQDFELPRMTPPPGGSGTAPPFGESGGMPSPGGPGRSSPEEEALMELPNLTDPLGIGGAAAGQPAGETPAAETPAPPDSQPGSGGTTDDTATDSSLPSSETPSTENATIEPEAVDGGEPTERSAKETGDPAEPSADAADGGTDDNTTPEPASDGEPVESSASPAESAPEAAGPTTQPEESGSDNE